MMEKTKKHKSLFLKFLPNAGSGVNFQSSPFSPGRDHHHNHNHNHNYHHSSTKLKSHASKGFSGPINFAALPDEARRKPNNTNGGYDSIEPTSPKVSCMGQIKCKHKKKKKKKKKLLNHLFVGNSTKSSRDIISKFFTSMKSPKNKDVKNSSTNRSKLSKSEDGKKVKKGDINENSKMMPSLGQMRKFASGRESLGNFDWTAQIAPIDNDRDCYSDEERRRDDSDDDEDEEEREVIIPFSAPILVGARNGEMFNNLEKRKEVCLWKRRTMDQPPPLALKSLR